MPVPERSLRLVACAAALFVASACGSAGAGGPVSAHDPVTAQLTERLKPLLTSLEQWNANQFSLQATEAAIRAGMARNHDDLAKFQTAFGTWKQTSSGAALPVAGPFSASSVTAFDSAFAAWLEVQTRIDQAAFPCGKKSRDGGKLLRCINEAVSPHEAEVTKAQSDLRAAANQMLPPSDTQAP